MTENHVRLPICFINAQTKEWVRPGSQTIVERLKTHFCGFSGNAVACPRSTLLPACLKLGPATPFTLLDASLGLEFDPQNKKISIVQSTATLVPRRSYVALSAARQIEHRP